jgi:hypothetical protein
LNSFGLEDSPGLRLRQLGANVRDIVGTSAVFCGLSDHVLTSRGETMIHPNVSDPNVGIDTRDVGIQVQNYGLARNNDSHVQLPHLLVYGVLGKDIEQNFGHLFGHALKADSMRVSRCSLGPFSKLSLRRLSV